MGGESPNRNSSILSLQNNKATIPAKSETTDYISWKWMWMDRVLAAKQNELSREISVRWLGHASSVLPAATRHPVHLFSSFSSLLFSVLKMTLTQNLLVWVGHQGHVRSSRIWKFLQLRCFRGYQDWRVCVIDFIMTWQNSTRRVRKPQTSSDGTHF